MFLLNLKKKHILDDFFISNLIPRSMNLLMVVAVISLASRNKTITDG